MARPIDFVRFLVVTVLGSVVGCSGPAQQFAPVEGKVTLNNRPLVGVIVKFYPENDSTTQLPVAMGTTDENGVFRLSISAKQAGALVGPNVAVVSWPVRDRSAPPTVLDVPIPVIYSVVADSPLRFDVKADSAQTINLILEDS